VVKAEECVVAWINIESMEGEKGPADNNLDSRRSLPANPAEKGWPTSSSLIQRGYCIGRIDR